MKLPIPTKAGGPVAGGSVGLPIWPQGTNEPIRVLLIDDDSDEMRLTKSLLARVEDIKYELDWVPTFSEGLASIARREHDAYLIDQRLGGRTGIELVREAREAGSLAALIMMTGQRDRTTDLAAMIAGATDFLLKGRTDAALLDRTLRYSINQAAMVSALERSRNQMAGLEELLRILVEDGPTPAAIGRVVDLIVDRFNLRQVAIYLVDGDMLHLAGQRGYKHPLASVSRSDSSVERVARARQPVFVPSRSPEPGARGADIGIAIDLSVPLLVAGELAGLLNVASSVAAPIGEEGHSAIRLVADRLTAALEVARERKVAEERLSKARQQLLGGHQPSGQQSVLDGDTATYRRALLLPLLEVAIASAGLDAVQNLGLLLLACNDPAPGAMTVLAQQARAAFPSRPLVRLADTEFAVIVAATGEAEARSEGQDLVALTQTAGLDVRVDYTALELGWGAAELIAEAQAAMVHARRAAPRTIFG